MPDVCNRCGVSNLFVKRGRCGVHLNNVMAGDGFGLPLTSMHGRITVMAMTAMFCYQKPGPTFDGSKCVTNQFRQTTGYGL